MATVSVRSNLEHDWRKKFELRVFSMFLKLHSEYYTKRMSSQSIDEIYQLRHFRQEAHLSFSSGMYFGIYHLGVLQAIKDFAPQFTKRRALGSSAGALAASCLVCDVPLQKAIDAVTKMAVHCRSLMFGALDPRFNISQILRSELYAILSPDAHIRANNKLFIAVTRASTLKHKLVSNFDSLDELIDTLMASCFIPFFLGLVPPKIKGVSYIDGGTSCRIPILNECTITVSPIRWRRAIIKPRKDLNNMLGLNFTAYMRRIVRMVFAPSPSELIDLCRQGYDDTVYFLRTNKLILCHECWDEENRDENAHMSTAQPHPIEKLQDCAQCQKLRTVSMLAKFPSIYYRSVAEAEENEQRLQRRVNILAFVLRNVRYVALSLLLIALAFYCKVFVSHIIA